MINPSQQQITYLKDYLRKLLSYRETYEEVFDHLMAALADQPSSLSFEQAINAVIKQDFNGPKGLLSLETQLAKRAASAAIKQQWENIKYYLKIQRLHYVGICYLISCYIIYYIPFTPFLFLSLFFIGALVPGILVMVRYFNIGYYFRDRKKSIRDKIIGLIAGRPLLILNPGLFFISFTSHKAKVNNWVHSHVFVCALLITLICTYVLAFIKLVKKELDLGYNRAV